MSKENLATLKYLESLLTHVPHDSDRGREIIYSINLIKKGA